MDGYECYALYLAVKRHFVIKKYDYIHYNGKTRVSPDSFNKRKDKFLFHLMSKKYAKEDILDLFVSNFIKDNALHVSNLLNQDAKDIMLDYKKRKQALAYTFTNETETMLSRVKFPDDLLKVYKGNNPLLLKAVYSSEISMETFIILNDILGFFDMFSAKIQDTYLWPVFRFKCEKYKSFIEYNKTKYSNILKEKLHEHSLTMD